MIAISLTFPAGRYHATPWGRHVNEGAVEWPPSPWRLLRSLVAVWKRTLPDVPEAEIKPVFETLAAIPPKFVLPPASTGHTRHYMPWYKKGPADRTLVFDAFVALDPNEASVHVIWPDAELDKTQRDLLARLLANLTFLGRAESWCEARLLSHADAAGVLENAAPLDAVSDPASRRDMELVRTLCADPATAFGNDRFTQEQVRTRGKKTTTETIRTAAHYDPDWHLVAETLWLHEQKWSDPPGSRWITYTRPRDCFEVKPSPRAPIRTRAHRVFGGSHSIEPPPRPLAAFKLLLPTADDDKLASFPHHRAVCVAAMLRHVACRAAELDSEFWEALGGSERFVAGHGPRKQSGRYVDEPWPRFSYIPLPSITPVGVGDIRRVLIAEPFGGDGRAAGWARTRLAGSLLHPEPRRRPWAELLRASVPDALEDAANPPRHAAAHYLAGLHACELPSVRGLKRWLHRQGPQRGEHRKVWPHVREMQAAIELQQGAQSTQTSCESHAASDRAAVALLEPLQTDPVLRRYVDSCNTWASVTPVMLPWPAGVSDPGRDGEDSHPGGSRSRRFMAEIESREPRLRLCLRQAGLPSEENDVAVDSRPTSWFPRVASSTQFKRPAYLRGLLSVHVRLRFREPVHGPIAIGAGRHCGLGVFAADT